MYKRQVVVCASTATAFVVMRRDDVARAVDVARGFAATRAVARRARGDEDAQTLAYRRSARVTRVTRPRADIDGAMSAAD